MASTIDEKCDSYELQFKNVDYIVSSYVDSIGGVQKLYLDVEDKMTAERWKGVFDATYIEDLTRKTGNFKQFSIFVSMLETALSRTSESVTVELYTFSDLEQLRNKKKEAISNNGVNSSSMSLTNANNNKRYFIMTYNVEFDRIHYPLQLNYQGKPDPVVLQELIRKLKNELKLYRTQPNGIDSKRTEYTKLQRDYEHVLKEKETIELELIECKRELKNRMQDTNEAMQKEIKILKQMIKNIEEDALKDKTSYQKQIHKKTRDYNVLLEECDELRASERNLKHQVKSLQTELAVYRRNRVFNESSRIKSRESSRENSLTRPSSGRQNSSRNSGSATLHRDRSLSRDSLTRRLSARDNISSSGTATNGTSSRNLRNLSRERELEIAAAVAAGLKKTNGIRSRSNSYERSKQQLSANRTSRAKSPSPARSIHSNRSSSGSRRQQKFDPTEYVKDKTRKLEEIELKKQRQIHMKMQNAGYDKMSFNSKNGSLKARTPSISSINSGLDSDSESMQSFKRSSTNRHHSKYEHQQPSWSLDHHDLLLKTSSSTPNNTLNASKKTGRNSTITAAATSKQQQKHHHKPKQHQRHHHKRVNNLNEVEIDDYDVVDDDDIVGEGGEGDDDEDDVDENDMTYDREKEIKEIDARLKSLQLFMKNNMP